MSSSPSSSPTTPPPPPHCPLQTPPYAYTSPHDPTSPLLDPFHFLRTKTDPRTQSYLSSENAYYSHFRRPGTRLRDIEDTLFDECKSRRQAKESMVPWRVTSAAEAAAGEGEGGGVGYWYGFGYVKEEEQYGRWVRWRNEPSGTGENCGRVGIVGGENPEQVLVDVEILAKEKREVVAVTQEEEEVKEDDEEETEGEGDSEDELKSKDGAAADDCYPYTSISTPRIDSTEKFLAYGIDHKGDRLYSIRILHLQDFSENPKPEPQPRRPSSEHRLITTIDGTVRKLAGTVCWGFVNQTPVVYYMEKDDAKRCYRLWSRKIFLEENQEEKEDDELIYEEKDITYELGLYGTSAGDYVMLTSASDTTREVWAIPRRRVVGPTSEETEQEGEIEGGEGSVTPKVRSDVLMCVLPRRKGSEYYVRQFWNSWVIFHNSKDMEHVNFRAVRLPISDSDPEQQRSSWESVKEIIPYDPDRYIMDVTCFARFIVLNVRERGFEKVYVLEFPDGGPPDTDDADSWWNSLQMNEVEFEEKNFSCWPSCNEVFDTTTVRFGFSSLVTPPSTFDYNMVDRELMLRQVRMPEGKYDRSLYKSEVLRVLSRDGEASIPVSLVYRPSKCEFKAHPVPVLIYGYGAYSFCNDPSFDRNIVSLLDRGFVYVLAHTRGGADCGYNWYRDGKLLNKKNTFYDFIDVAQFFIDQDWTSSSQMFAYGASAGGLLMGAIFHLAPRVFRGIVAEVPFVDVIFTMVDESIPLTAQEWEEWGNPIKSKEEYLYMLSYSPYDRVEDLHGEVPAFFIRGSMNDSAVQYWEPLKLAARLRHLVSTGQIQSESLLCRINCDAGHCGASGRYEVIREYAQIYSWMIHLVSGDE